MPSSTWPGGSMRTTRIGCRRSAVEVVELLTPGGNPFHEHATVQLFLARRGRRSRRADFRPYRSSRAEPAAEQGMGPGTGNWGLFEAEDEEVAHALIAAAEALAEAAGHEPRARADQPVCMGRARPAGHGPRPSANDHDGTRRSALSGLDRSCRLHQGEEPQNLGTRHHQWLSRRSSSASCNRASATRGSIYAR